MNPLRHLGPFAPTLLLGALIALGASAEEAAPPTHADSLAKATFAGGCFWCMEPPFDKLDGVVSTTSGYTGGRKSNPTYKQISAGGTGHAEAVQVLYDPDQVSYAELLEVFWRNIDPTTLNRQFCDVGDQYRTAVFYHDSEQKRLSEESKKRIETSQRFDGPIVTGIVEASEFWPAEEYHQDYYKKSPLRYKFYRYNCGRDRRLKELWGGDSSQPHPNHLRRRLGKPWPRVVPKEQARAPFAQAPTSRR